MNREKAKEIKKVLEMFAIDDKEMTLFQSPVLQGESCVKTIKYGDILTLINELENENELFKEENERFENNMRAVLEIEKKQAVKEFGEKNDRIQKLALV